MNKTRQNIIGLDRIPYYKAMIAAVPDCKARLRRIPVAGCLALTLAVATAQPSAVRSRLLSDNAHYDGPRKETGMTYTWEFQPTNPADASGRRLVDGDRPVNWDTITGWNYRDNAVVFDFKQPLHFTKAAFHFHSALPAYVEIQRAESSAGDAPSDWQPLARIDAPVEGWNTVRMPDAPAARHLRVFVKLDKWGVYFREARFFGLPPSDRKQLAPEPQKDGKNRVLVRSGVPHASIVVDPDADEATLQAAWLLRDTIQAMTDGELPLFATSENPSGARIFVGNGRLTEPLGVTVPQSDRPGTERYRIQSVGDDLVLVGNDAGDYRGTIFAVYDLLQRLGCGWYAPDPLYHVIPRKALLAVPPLDIDARPAFHMRDIWMVRGDPQLKDAWRLGGFQVRFGHTLYSLVPVSLKEAHPDWFGPGQPCLTHPEVHQHIAAQLRERLDQAPDRFLSLSIGQNDNEGFCVCERCAAAGNPSARFLHFANSIADMLRETHAGRFQLGFLAYWVTHAPPEPMVEARPEVTVLIVNEGDHTKPLDMPVPPENARRGRNNLREQNAIAGWLKSGALQGVYEWWIPGCSNKSWRHLPWYSGETALRNLRYWRERGLQYLTYETDYEAGDGFPLRWPLYYVAARGLWDPDLTAEAIMRGACEKLFGDAVEPMQGYYATLEQAMLETPHPGGNWHLPSGELIYTPDIEARATAYLDRAAETTEDSQALARIASERAVWNRARATLADLRAATEAGAFTVQFNEATRFWAEPAISAQTLRDIFGIPPDLPLQAIEQDGQTRDIQPGEQFDLRTGITFKSEEDHETPQL